LLGRDQPHQIRIQEHRVAAVVAGGYSEIDAREGSVAVIDQDEVTVLDARGGTPRWSRPLPTAGLRAHAPAAILDGQLLIPSISSAWAPYDE
jgi:hypothetical protein